MQAIIYPSIISGEIDSPKSKSIAIRILFSSLLKDITLKENVPTSLDVIYTYDSIIKLGVRVDDKRLIKPNRINLLNNKFYAGGSATLARILSSIALTIGGDIIIDGNETLRNRPFDGLEKISNSTGVKISGTKLPIRIYGKPKSNEIFLSEIESSQYVTGLIYGLLAKGGGEIIIDKNPPSLYYILLTIDTLNNIGCNVSYNDNIINVGKCNEKEISLSFPGDYLLSSFYGISSILTGGEIKIKGLYSPPNYFGDHSIVNILSEIGFKSIVSGTTWIVSNSNPIKNLYVDIEETPDIAMSLAPLGMIINLNINNIKILKIKESNRIESIKNIIEGFGGRVRINDNSIELYPNVIRYAETDCFNDHRVAMMASTIAFIKGGKIRNAECVNKSDPDYWHRYYNVGGRLKVE
ncbi:MAG: 3-phosphoshikimate 1-carboxyvinyltransferase [Caldisphaera sp.]|jgi:3-phosphoshikimate 1-carboxyvinyltransferase